MSTLLVKFPRYEFVDAGGGMACCNGLQGSLEIGVWLNVVELAGFNERRDARSGSTALVVAREQRIFAIENNGADGALDNVTVYLDGAVAQK